MDARYLYRDAWVYYPLRQRVIRHRHAKPLPRELCRVCRKRILWLDWYYDGGRGRRGHQLCVESLPYRAARAKMNKEKES